MKYRANLFTALSLSIAAVTPLRAASLYWDGSSTTVDADGGNGTWNSVVSNLNWANAAAAGTAVAWPSSSSGNDDAVFGGTSGTVTVDVGGITVNDMTFSTDNYLITGAKITLDGTTPTITNAGPAAISSEVGGTVGLVKAGAGTLTLSAVNSYTGTTTLSAGTLLLSGGGNRLTTAGSISFSGGSTLDLGGNSQVLGNVAVAVGGAVTDTITNGSLTLSGGTDLLLSPTGVATSTYLLDASGLSSLTISKSGKAFTVTGNGTATGAQTSTFKLSSSTNTITASALNVGSTGGTGSIVNGGTLSLGTTNTLNITNVNVGTTRSNANVSFQSGLTNPTVTLRGINGGTERVTKLLVGVNGAGSTPGNTQVVDFSLGSLDMRVTDLVISQGQSVSGSAATPSVNGTFTMGAGTLDASTITISDDAGGGGNTTNTGIFNQNAGTVLVPTLTLGQRASTAPAPKLLPTYTVGSTSTSGVLKVTTVQAGGGTVATTTVRNLSFKNGTIQTYDGTADLTINGSSTATENKVNVVLASTGTHAFFADPGRTITIGANTTVSGTSGSLTKTGTGTLVLAGTNSYTGVTDVQNGTLLLTTALGGSSSLNLGNGTDSGKVILGNAAALATTVAGLTTAGSGTGNAMVGSASAVSALTVNLTSGSNTFAGKLGGTGTNENSLSLTKTGAGTLTLSTANTHTGGTTIGSGAGTASGVLAVTHAQALGTGAITILGSNSTSGTLQLSNNISITGAGAVSLYYSRTQVSGGGSAHIENLSGNNSLSSNLTLSTAATGGTGANIVSTAGTLTLTGNLSNTNSSVRAFVFTGAGNTTVSGNILTGSGGGTSVIKDGSGTLTLTGTGDTYAGGTTVNGGTLLVNSASGSATGSGAVAVNGGTLSGTGSISGTVTVGASGTVDPGTSSTVGTLTVLGGVSGSGSLGIEVDGATADQLVVGGTLDISSLKLNLTALNTPTQPVYVIVNAASAITGSAFASVTGIPAGYTLSYNYNDGTDSYNIALVTSGSPFANWATTTHGLTGAAAEPGADPDKDGLSNLLEFVLGSEPNPANANASSAALAPKLTLGASNFIFTYRRSQLAMTQSGITVTAEYGSSLSGWTLAADGVAGVSISTIIGGEAGGFESGIDKVIVTIPRSLATDGKIFARLHVAMP